MKRSAPEDCQKSESNVKKMRTDLNASNASESAGDSSLLVQNSLQPKDGIIEEVRVTNFMTFTSHRFRFQENINFVMGLNGSGKSSIVAALTVALGSRAGATSRGHALKSLIKHGKRVAEVAVMLRNSSTDAYHHEVYGDSIIVKRRLTMEGGSSYKICTSENKVVSTKREELDMILDFFNIQVDNPIVILNQHASKEFLLSNTPKDMYRFFMRATLLEQLLTEYNETIEAKSIAQEELQKKQEELQLMKQEVQRYQRAYDACSSIDKLRDKINKLKEEMAWAFVCEKEKLLEKAIKELKAEEARRPKFVQKLEECEKKYEEKQKEHSRLEEELKSASEEAMGLQPQLVNKKSTVDACRKTVKITSDDLRRAQNNLRGVSADRDHIQKRIDDLRGSAQIDYTARRQEREQKISELEQQARNLSAECQTIELNIQGMRNVITTEQQRRNDLESEEQTVRYRLTDTSNKLQKLEASRSNELRRFGTWMPDLVKRVDDAHRQGKFHQKPRGPIGANIKLRDGRWSVAIEKCIGQGLLCGFCVNDFHDEKAFLEIAKQVCPRQNMPNTMTSKFLNHVHNVPRNPNKFPTVLEMLDISDPVIANCLIDHRRIEFVLLCESKDEAADTMLYNPPPRYGEMFTMNGDQVFSWPCFRLYPSKPTSARFLSADVEQLIDKCRSDRDHLNVAAREKTEEVAQAKNGIKKKMEELRKAERQLQDLRRNIGNTNMEISELKNVDDPTPGDMRMLEEELELCNRKIRELEAKVNVTKTAMDNAVSSLKDAEAEMNDAEERVRTVTDQLTPFQESLAHVHSDLQRAGDNVSYYAKKMKEFESKVTDMRQRQEVAEKVVADSVSKASQISAERIETRRTAENISSEIQQVQVQIEAERNQHGDPEQLREDLYNRKVRCVEVSDDLRLLSSFLVRLSEMMKIRTSWFEETRRSISTLLRAYFSRFVSVQKNLTGRLHISHTDGTVEPVIERTDDAASDHHRSSLRGLSGGERSFVMTCFILSLWNLIESPFSCLDEFDVFMDHINRQHCLDMLLKFSTTQSNGISRQFIILSPLTLAQWNLTKENVNVLHLTAPKREQQQLPDLSHTPD